MAPATKQICRTWWAGPNLKSLNHPMTHTAGLQDTPCCRHKGVPKNEAAQTNILCSALQAQPLKTVWSTNVVPMCHCVPMNSEWTQNVKNTSGCIRPLKVSSEPIFIESAQWGRFSENHFQTDFKAVWYTLMYFWHSEFILSSMGHNGTLAQH